MGRIPGALSLDIDEESNRLTIGVATEPTRAEVETELRRLRIPDGAAAVETRAPAVPLQASLASSIRPTRGGLRIWVPRFAPNNYGTLGFNAVYNGRRAFASNGHCSTSTHAVDPSHFYQGGSAYGQSGFFIGTEFLNEGTFTSAQSVLPLPCVRAVQVE